MRSTTMPTSHPHVQSRQHHQLHYPALDHVIRSTTVSYNLDFCIRFAVRYFFQNFPCLWNKTHSCMSFSSLQLRGNIIHLCFQRRNVSQGRFGLPFSKIYLAIGSKMRATHLASNLAHHGEPRQQPKTPRGTSSHSTLD